MKQEKGKRASAKKIGGVSVLQQFLKKKDSIKTSSPKREGQ